MLVDVIVSHLFVTFLLAMYRSRTVASSTSATSSTTSGWIQSERRPQRTRSLQTRLVLCDLVDNDDGVAPRRLTRTLSSTSTRLPECTSTYKQLILTMNKDKNNTPQSLAVSANTRSRSRNSSQDEAKGKEQTKDMERDTDKTSSDSLAAIQEKLSKFQPKINSMLPRMLNKGGIATPKSTPAEKKSSSAKPSQSRKLESPATIATAAKPPGKSTTTATSAAAETAVNATPEAETPASSSKAKAKKRPSGPVTSVATLIPKGSRKKVQEPALQPPPKERTVRAGDEPDQAIILSASLPSLSSLPSLMELDDGHREALGDGKGKGRSGDFDTPQTYSLDATSSIVSKADGPLVQDKTTRTAAAVKTPSIISVDSFRSDNYASGIPSVQVERIANWMGGVKDAMERDDSQKIPDTAAPVLPAVVEASETKKNDTPNNETTGEAAAAVAGTHRTALRRPPPMIPRHAAARVSSSPSPPQREQIGSPDIIDSSLECTPLAATTTTEEDLGKSKYSPTKDTVHSFPPVPLFNEALDVSEGHTHAAESSSKTTAKAVSTGAAALRRSDLHDDDDRSTVVGGQQTQDSIGGLASLPSSEYGNNGDADEKDERPLNRIQQEPSLPSALTSSCLRELGILKRKSSTNRTGSGKRRIGNDASFTQENVEDEDEDDGGGIILAQREVFPSSIGAAPASPSLLSASCDVDVLEAPTYAFALPNRIRQDNPRRASAHSEQDLDDCGAPRIQQGQQPVVSSSVGLDMRSFPSPPSHISFSTLPTIPTFPSFPSNDPGPLYESGQEEGWTQGQNQNPSQEPSQSPSSALPSITILPSEVTNEPSLIIIDSPSQSLEEEP